MMPFAGLFDARARDLNLHITKRKLELWLLLKISVTNDDEEEEDTICKAWLFIIQCTTVVWIQ